MVTNMGFSYHCWQWLIYSWEIENIMVWLMCFFGPLHISSLIFSLLIHLFSFSPFLNLQSSLFTAYITIPLFSPSSPNHRSHLLEKHSVNLSADAPIDVSLCKTHKIFCLRSIPFLLVYQHNDEKNSHGREIDDEKKCR